MQVFMDFYGNILLLNFGSGLAPWVKSPVDLTLEYVAFGEVQTLPWAVDCASSHGGGINRELSKN